MDKITRPIPEYGTHPAAAADSIEAGDLICRYLDQIGVEYVFGIPGGSLEPFYSALARSERRGGVRPIVARHESGAAFMADGYARESGRLGVCCATTGPGATNMITGVASAYQDNVPLLVITAQTALHTFGRGGVQESSSDGVDTVAMYSHCARYSTLVSHISQLERKLVAAAMAAMGVPRGPAHLSVPLDIMRQRVDRDRPAYDLAGLIERKPLVDHAAVDRLYRLLSEAERPVFLIGSQCERAVGSLLETALLLNAPVVTTPQAKTLVSALHPLARGVFGFAGHSTAHDTLADTAVDLVVAVGTRLDEHSSNGWDEEALLNKRLVHISEVAEYLVRSPQARLHVQGDIPAVFDVLLSRLRDTREGPIQAAAAEGAARDAPLPGEVRTAPKTEGAPSAAIKHVRRLKVVTDSGTVDPKWRNRSYTLRRFDLIDEYKCFENTSPIKPQRLMFDLSRLFPPTTRYLADIGNAFLWAIHYLQPLNRRMVGRRDGGGNGLRMAMGFASMGWAIGGAVGIAAAARGCPVVSIVGDGSYLMCGQEITVAAREGLPVIYVILNDAIYGTVKHGQRMAGAEAVGYELPNVDFVQMAAAMGVAGHSIRSPGDFSELDIEAICRRRGPTVLDVFIDADEVPPLAARIKVLGWDSEKRT